MQRNSVIGQVILKSAERAERGRFLNYERDYASNRAVMFTSQPSAYYKIDFEISV